MTNLTVQDTPLTAPAICEHRAGPWSDSPIGRELLTQLVGGGQLEPTPCHDCTPATEVIP